MHFSPDNWKTGPLPFAFKYGGKDSATFLSTWQKSAVETEPAPGGQIDRQSFTDPATGLRITAEVRTFKDFDATEWVLHFANTGQADTPIIEDIAPLSVSLPVPEGAAAVLHSAAGSTAVQTDFQPQDHPLGPGANVQFGSKGRPSETSLPYFNLQAGDGGVIGAIGWTGSWNASFNCNHDGKSVAAAAGMAKTHLLLHPGEEIRTPRILLLNWAGDRDDAQNTWRRLLRAYYTPQIKDAPVVAPTCLMSWGNEPMAMKMARVQELVKNKVPLDVYWIDAGWYGKEDYHPGSNVFNTPWYSNRGNWWSDKANYPDGFAPLGDYLHQHGMEFLLWIEPEEADKGTDLLVQHPDWFLPHGNGGGLLNLGDPAARKGITDLISGLMTQGKFDWYRQDFNTDPSTSWTDAPDRVGMTEIRYVEGLYAFLDDLRARDPGLKIDNCSSGGRRLDLEMISRTVSLWRSDYLCFKYDATGPQLQTLGLAPWIPLSSGASVGGDVYSMRSGYGTGLSVDAGCMVPDRHDDAALKATIDEFHEVRPYFYGDFYPLTEFNPSPEMWAAMQFDRPDLKAGIALFFRRQNSPYPTFEARLRKIDPAATYAVEMRTGQTPVPPKTMSGKDLAALDVTLPDKTSSVLIFYKKM